MNIIRRTVSPLSDDLLERDLTTYIIKSYTFLVNLSGSGEKDPFKSYFQANHIQKLPKYVGI